MYKKWDSSFTPEYLVVNTLWYRSLILAWILCVRCMYLQMFSTKWYLKLHVYAFNNKEKVERIVKISHKIIHQLNLKLTWFTENYMHKYVSECMIYSNEIETVFITLIGLGSIIFCTLYSSFCRRKIIHIRDFQWANLSHPVCTSKL